jgi:hypothetical protein
MNFQKPENLQKALAAQVVINAFLAQYVNSPEYIKLFGSTALVQLDVENQSYEVAWYIVCNASSLSTERSEFEGDAAKGAAAIDAVFDRFEIYDEAISSFRAAILDEHDILVRAAKQQPKPKS